MIPAQKMGPAASKGYPAGTFSSEDLKMIERESVIDHVSSLSSPDQRPEFKISMTAP